MRLSILPTYAITLGCLVFGYPIVRGEYLRMAYLGVELTALLIATGTMIAWFRSGMWKTGSLEHVATAAVILVDLTLLATGPWTRGFFGAAWISQEGGLVALYGSLTLIQIAALWQRAP